MNQPVTNIQPASEVSQQALLLALNAAYADYFVPIYLTPQSFRDLVTRESIRLECSRAAVDGEEVIGTGLMGVRGAHGWIGGVGVVPAHRQHGIAREVMQHLIEAARQIGLSTLQLEVITRNKPALALYRSLDFNTIRELLVLVCEQAYTSVPPERIAPEILIGAEPANLLLARLEELPAATRPWQREIDAQRIVLPSLKALAARRADGSLAGVCIYRRSGTRIDLIDLAASAPRIGRALAVHLLRSAPGASFSYLNVADGDPLLTDLLQIGFKRSISQLEMVLPLDPETQSA